MVDKFVLLNDKTSVHFMSLIALLSTKDSFVEENIGVVDNFLDKGML